MAALARARSVKGVALSAFSLPRAAAAAAGVGEQCAATATTIFQRRHASLVTNLAKAAVNYAIDKKVAAAKNGSEKRAPAQEGNALQDATDVETWKALVDQPVVSFADDVSSDDLYLVSDRMCEAVDLAGYPEASGTDPFACVGEDLGKLNDSIRSILGVDHPVLSRVAKYFFDFDGGKKLRPALVLLMSRAVNQHIALENAERAAAATAATDAADAAAGQQKGASSSSSSFSSSSGSDSYSRADGLPSSLRGQVLAAAGGSSSSSSGSLDSLAIQQLQPGAIWPLQQRLAEITEMIHTASLLHDDVIDAADTRRGVQSVNSVFGNKLAVLAGDFLLARASVCLARLRNIPTVECMSTMIEHLVKGEVMQMRSAIVAAVAANRKAAAVASSFLPGFASASASSSSSAEEQAGAGAGSLGLDQSERLQRERDANSRAAMELYLRKTYYKTGSLIANSCKSVALLGGYPQPICDAAFRYGLHVGVAFQLVDDLLDFEGTAASLGKPALNDLKQGLSTAPVLFAASQYPATLLPLMERKFDRPGDVDAAVRCVAESDGMASTRRLAVAHGQRALEVLQVLRPSPERTALAAMVTKVLSRTR